MRDSDRQKGSPRTREDPCHQPTPNSKSTSKLRSFERRGHSIAWEGKRSAEVRVVLGSWLGREEQEIIKGWRGDIMNVLLKKLNSEAA